MTTKPRPDLAIRLIGPAIAVQTMLYHFTYVLKAIHGTDNWFRIHTTLARHPGEIRSYIIVRRREAPR